MKKHLELSLFIFLNILFVFFAAAPALAEQEIPQKIQRNWAQPDCGTYDEAVVLSRNFYLHATADEITLMQASLKADKGDYWLLDLAGAETPARLENDGILKIGVLAANGAPAGAWPQDWEKLRLDDTEEYAGCLEPPKVVPKVLQRLMRYIDRIKAQCTISVTNECAGVLFKLADENGDRKLSAAEIRRTALSAILFAELADKKTLSTKDALKLVADSKIQAQQIAEELLAAHGKTKDQSLNYNELMADFKPPHVPVIKQTLEKAGVLLPSFKVVAMTLD